MTDQVNILGPSSEHVALTLLLNHQDLIMLVATFGGMLVLLMWERVWPRRHSPDLPISRWWNNWLLGYLNFAIILWLLRLVEQSSWFAALRPEQSLLEHMHPALALLLLLFIVEGITYALHRLFHVSPLLWRFHAVHHLDTEVDVTTSHRHHIVEVLATTLIVMSIIFLLNVPAVIVMFVALLRLMIALMSHSNLDLPESVDRRLRWFIVTPDFHRLHHSSDPRHTNSNYGAVFPWFDYLFNTVSTVPYKEQRHMQLGLEYLRGRRDSRLDQLLLLPFVWKRRALPI
ncbi:hypothetical protein CCR95_06395 [Thiocystis minor]|uniref:sterol desaturase family protein n=1 Tax=Thiocystis minor TaxID=61597 RepID=UPI001911930B|nr:sterol desaturase family protein [Thiocystis minor]MBK5963723.1 hypothetical protein [Thiocystis minor]